MGWASGTELFIDTWGALRRYVPEEQRAEICAKVIDCFTNQDWDTEGEIADVWPENHAALLIYDPHWDDDLEFYEEEDGS